MRKSIYFYPLGCLAHISPKGMPSAHIMRSHIPISPHLPRRDAFGTHLSQRDAFGTHFLIHIHLHFAKRIFHFGAGAEYHVSTFDNVAINLFGGVNRFTINVQGK